MVLTTLNKFSLHIQRIYSLKDGPTQLNCNAYCWEVESVGKKGKFLLYMYIHTYICNLNQYI